MLPDAPAAISESRHSCGLNNGRGEAIDHDNAHPGVAWIVRDDQDQGVSGYVFATSLRCSGQSTRNGRS